MRLNFNKLLAGLVALGAAGTCVAAGVTDVSTRDIVGGLAVHVGGAGLRKPTSSWDAGALQLRFDVPLVGKSATLRPNRGGIASFSYSQRNGCAIVAVRPQSALDPRIAPVSDGWLVSFGPPAKPTEVDKPASDPADVICSVQVREMDPAQILETLSAQTHTNFLLLSKPSATLTIHMVKVPLSEMIRYICALCDLSYLRVGKQYVIATPDRLKSAFPVEWAAIHPPVLQETPPTPERVTRTYLTGYATAQDLEKVLEQLYTGKDVSFVSGPASIDPQIGTQDSEKVTGASSSILAKAQQGESASRTLLVTGEKSVVLAALESAKELDQPRQQVSISVTIHDISDDDLRDLGITWDFGSETFQESAHKGIGFGTFGRSPLTISTALTALDQSQRSKLLASPTISVLDGDHAFVLIGQRISYPVLVGYSQSNAPIFSKEEQRVGIYLQVTASIGLDGAVTLSLYPQVSTITGYLNINGASYPQIATREAQTTLMVHSGETIVMGGLFSNEEVAAMDKVPFLSQIPVLGELFKHRKTTKNKSQVIITVTPKIIPRKAQ